MVSGGPKLDVDLDSGQQGRQRSEEHTSELQSQSNLVCRLLLEKKHNQTSRRRVCRSASSSIRETRRSTRTEKLSTASESKAMADTQSIAIQPTSISQSTR